MKNLNMKEKEKTHHFSTFARIKVRELGIDGAVQYFKHEIQYYKNNPLYEKSWLYMTVARMSIEYIVNDIQR